jgi:hypothetical protein
MASGSRGSTCKASWKGAQQELHFDHCIPIAARGVRALRYTTALDSLCQDLEAIPQAAAWWREPHVCRSQRQ